MSWLVYMGIRVSLYVVSVVACKVTYFFQETANENRNFFCLSKSVIFLVFHFCISTKKINFASAL